MILSTICLKILRYKTLWPMTNENHWIFWNSKLFTLKLLIRKSVATSFMVSISPTDKLLEVVQSKAD